MCIKLKVPDRWKSM